jgi:hypothetical protein
VAKTLVSSWISHFGVPDTITHDRGTQFESQLFNHLANLLGSKRISTSAYNPRANGMVERFHRQLKGVLRCLKADTNWTDPLPLVMLGIRSTVKADLKATPAEMVYGTNLTLPADMVNCDNNPPITNPVEFVENLRRQMHKVQTVLSRAPTNPPQYIPEDLSTCDYVMKRTDSNRTPLQRPYTGPYEVMSRNRYTITIKTNNGPEDVSFDRLKPARVDPDTVVYDQPRRRGRPRAEVTEITRPLGGSDVAAAGDTPSSPPFDRTLVNTVRTTNTCHTYKERTRFASRYFYCSSQLVN